MLSLIDAKEQMNTSANVWNMGVFENKMCFYEDMFDKKLWNIATYKLQGQVKVT